MEAAFDYWAKSERRLAEAGHTAPSQVVDTGHHDPAHPSAQDKLAAEDQDDLGLAYYRQDNFKAASTAFLRACRLDGSNGVVQTHLALLFEKQQKYAEEETAFRELMKRVPALPHSHYWLGKALYLQRKYAEADLELRKAIALASPDRWIYHYMLAKSLGAEGKRAEAAAEQQISDRIRKSQPQETP